VVGAATGINAPAARMRYNRLKKNIESKLGENSKKAPVASIKALAVSTSTQVNKNAKPGLGPGRKRKVLHESEKEEPDTPTLDEKIGNDTIEAQDFKEWTAGRRTRGKKINLKDAFDSDSSSGPKLRNEDHDSSDDYEIDEVSEDEEEYHAEEAKDESDELASTRRKSVSQPASRKMSTNKSAIKVSKNSRKAILRIESDKNTGETLPRPGSPVTPESGLSGRSETKGESVTLPPTPKSMRTGALKQESADWASAAPNARPGAPQLSPAAKPKKIRPASQEPSLFDRIENARIQADHNPAFLSYQPNKSSQSYSNQPKTTTETVLPSIEVDDDDQDSAILDVSSRASGMITLPSSSFGRFDCKC
jgi:hypothetical protein